MPVYLDRHEDLGGISAIDLAAAHMRALAVQDKYGVKYLTYWFDYELQKAWCLVDAPSAEVAASVHAEASGLMANKIIPVDPDMMHRFLGGVGAEEPPEWNPDGVNESTVRTIVFTDIVGSTETAQRLGDEAAMDVVRTHNQIVRDALAAHGGREIKHTGDGIMASFESVTGAVECSIAVQKKFGEHNSDPTRPPVHVRIGLAAGEPITENEDLYGSAVNLAARICDVAEAGSVFVSNVVRELTIGKQFQFENARELALKGFADPIAVAKVVFA